MAKGKWFPSFTADMPAAEAAEHVLATRLQIVTAAIPRAVDTPDEVENVHKLRVACRRASAAVRIARPFFSTKTRRHAQDLLRSLRRAAGEARNWDVFLDHLDTSQVLQESDHADAHNFLTGYAFRERDTAQVLLSAVVAEQGEALAKLAQELPRAVRKPARTNPDVHTLAEKEVLELVADVNQLIAANPTTPEELHRLRIACKRLRYSLEVFAACLTPAFQDNVAATVNHLQESLGILQDSHVFVTRLTRILSLLQYLRPAVGRRMRPGLQALVRESRQRATVERRNYRTLLREWRSLDRTGVLANPLPSKPEVANIEA